MSTESTQAPATPTAKKSSGVPVWVLVVTLVVVAALAGGTAWLIASRDKDKADDVAEATATVEPEAEDETPPAGEQQPPATQPPAAQQPKPSYVRFAYVRAVTGGPGSWAASLDFFEILTSPEAEDYASSHGIAVPDNGILYVNESEVPESVPVSDAVVITYTTGGVEAMETHAATIEQLRDYSAGSSTAMPDAYRDQWRVTVESGVVVKIEMIAVAD